jgi:hypothetical protein
MARRWKRSEGWRFGGQKLSNAPPLFRFGISAESGFGAGEQQRSPRGLLFLFGLGAVTTDVDLSTLPFRNRTASQTMISGTSNTLTSSTKKNLEFNMKVHVP